MNTARRHVKVVVRTRPTSNFAQDLIQFSEDKRNIMIHIPKNEEWGHVNNQNEDWSFKLDKILHNASQESVYEECGAPIVKSLLEGYNAYGSTGGGKTFTMTGSSENYKHRGLIPRAISNLFRIIAERADLAISIRISYLEIYNEQMIDLISSVLEPMTVVEDKNGSTFVKGLTHKVVNSEEEALNLLFEGESVRAISEHQLNRHSSRSHCIFTIHLESRSRVESSEKVMISKLNLVDLAGSERLSKTGTNGVSLKEAMCNHNSNIDINRSLTYLEQVIIALSDKKRDHVPFRQSKMTHVLRDALGGNCNTLMIANIWGQEEQIEETISTLRFSTRMMCVSVAPEINIQYDPLAMIKKYEREIKELKQELRMHDTLANRSNIQYDVYTEAQKANLSRQIHHFIESEADEPEVINLRQIKELLTIFRTMYKTLETDSNEKTIHLINTSGGEGVEKPAISGVDDIIEGVGDVEGIGFGVGVAPLGKRVVKVSNVTPKIRKQDGEKFLSEEHLVQRIAPMSRAEEFENFKRGKGAEISHTLGETKSLKEKRKQAKDMAELISSTKSQIDALKLKVSGIASDANIINEADFDLLKSLRELKLYYSSLYENLKPIRSEIENCTNLTDQCRQKLVAEFEDWYGFTYSNRLTSPGKDDVLDIGEKFERLQVERMSQEDPDSLAFYSAKKNATIKKI